MRDSLTAVRYINFNVAVSATGADPTVTPKSGNALDTLFTLSVASWHSTEDNNLSYFFSYKSSTEWIDINTKSSTSVQTKLPTGDAKNSFRLPLKLRVEGELGSIVEREFSVTVTQSTPGKGDGDDPTKEEDDPVKKLADYVNSIKTSDPQLLNQLSVVAGMLNQMNFAKLTKDQMSQLRTIIQSVLNMLATYVKSLVSSIKNGQVAQLNSNVFQQIVSIVVSCSNPTVMTDRIRTLLVQIPNTLLGLDSSKMEKGLFSDSAINNVATIADNVATYSKADTVFRLDLRTIIDATLDKITDTSTVLTYKHVLSKTMFGLAAIGGTKASTLGQAWTVAQGVTPRSINNNNNSPTVTVTVNSIVSDSLAGDFATLQTTVFARPPFEFKSGTIASTTVVPRVVGGTANDETYQSLAVDELVVISFPPVTTSYDQSTESPRCHFYASTGQWDMTTCTTVLSATTAVECHCKQFGPVLVAITATDKEFTKDAKGGGMSKGGIAALVVVLSSTGIILCIAAAIIVSIVIWLKVRQNKKNGGGGDGGSGAEYLDE